jgi:hypothetical protein
VAQKALTDLHPHTRTQRNRQRAGFSGIQLDGADMQKRRCVSSLFAAAFLLADGGARNCHALPQDGGRARLPVGVGNGLSVGLRNCPDASLRRLPAGEPASPHNLGLRGGSQFMSTASLLTQNPDMAKSVLGSKMFSKTRKYGFVILGLGILLSFLGFMFFFNRQAYNHDYFLLLQNIIKVLPFYEFQWDHIFMIMGYHKLHYHQDPDWHGQPPHHWRRCPDCRSGKKKTNTHHLEKIMTSVFQGLHKRIKCKS